MFVADVRLAVRAIAVSVNGVYASRETYTRYPTKFRDKRKHCPPSPVNIPANIVFKSLLPRQLASRNAIYDKVIAFYNAEITSSYLR